MAIQTVHELFFTLLLIFAPPNATSMTAELTKDTKVVYTTTANDVWSVTGLQAPANTVLTRKGDDLTLDRPGRDARRSKMSQLVPRPRDFDPKTAKTMKLNGGEVTISRLSNHRVVLGPPEGRGQPLLLRYTVRGGSKDKTRKAPAKK